MLHVYSNTSCDCVTCVSLFNLRHSRDFTSPPSRRRTLLFTNLFLLGHLHAFLRRPYIFSRTLCWGARRGPACTPRRNYKVWAPGGLCGACSGRSKSQNLLSNHGVAFREARAEQDNGKPTCQHCSSKSLQDGSNNRFKLSSVLQLRTLLYVCGPLLCMCGNDVCVYALCLLRARVWCARVCPCVTHASPHSVVACWAGHIHVSICSSS